MRMFPSLVNCTTINWVDSWPEDALLSVSQNKMLDLDLSDMPKDESDLIRSNLAVMCKEIHTSVEQASEQFYAVYRRKVYITPKSFLDLMNLFFNLLATKRDELNSNKERYVGGVQMLINTNKEVA
jgi:dynein heavy chain